MGRLARALADAETRTRWTVAGALALVLGLCTLALALAHDGQGRPIARPYADAPYYYAYAPTLFLDHDVDFTDEYQETKNWYRLPPTPLHRPGNVFGAGPAILSAPAFLVGHAAAVIAGERRDGFSTVEAWLVMWTSALLSVLALVFPYRIAARRLGAPGAGLAAAILTFAAGPVVYYAIRQPGYAHPFATFFAAWLCDAWDASYQRERTARTWALLGAAFGLAVLARPQLATWGFVLGLAALDDVRRRRATPRILAARWATAAAVAIACITPQLLIWKALYGAYYVVPQGAGFMRWTAPAWSEVLFSSRNGLLPWAPLYALGLGGLVYALGRAPRVAGALLAGLALQVWVNGAAWDWWGGGSFGGRRFDSTFVAFAFGLAAVLAPAARAIARVRVQPRAIAAALAAAAAIATSLALALANVRLAFHHAAPTARIYGGESASRVIKREVDGRVGRFAARASHLVNLPARAWFAAAYDRDLDAYDQIVGVHWLGETYPGLNSFQPRTEEHRTIAQIPDAFRRGLIPARDGGFMLAGHHARIFITLNRTGGLRVVLTSGAVALHWNGRPVTSPFETRSLHRGVNLLDITGAPGTAVRSIELYALP